MRPASLFRSRWAALLYAAGVLWFAVDISGTKPEAPANEATASTANAAADDASIAALENQVHAFEAMK